MLLTHIRFLNRLRSTASPILSHFHTLLRLTLSAPITVSGFNSCQALNFPLNARISSFLQNTQFTSFPACYVIPVSTSTQLPCREPQRQEAFT